MHPTKMVKKVIKKCLAIKRRSDYAKQGVMIGKLSLLRQRIEVESPAMIHNASIMEDCFIGKNSYIVSGTIYSKVRIGRYCSIAINVVIGALEHPTNWLSTSNFQYSPTRRFDPDATIDSEKQTLIGNDVWIGANAFIKRGVIVGDGAIIAAGAVVTKDVQPYSIVGGVPARLIKFRFDDQIIRRLLKAQWWNLPEDHLNGLPFSDVAQCLTILEARQSRS